MNNESLACDMTCVGHEMTFPPTQDPCNCGGGMPETLHLRGKYGNAQSGEVLAMLGLKPGHHLPKEGMPVRKIQGIEVWVASSDVKKNRFTHRVMAKCPVCGKAMSAGRLHQHATIHAPTKAP